MRRGGRSGWACAAAVSWLATCACRTAPQPAAAAAPGAPAAAERKAAPQVAAQPPSFAAQPATRLADAEGIAVVALAAPQFAALPRDQRLVAWYATQAAAAGDRIAADQGYRHNLAVIRVLRGILSRPQVAPAALLARIRSFARVVYLNHGLHDAETGRKQLPPFTAAELRTAALAASAAGADLGLGGAGLEYPLRALEGALFDPRVDARRTVHGADLTASAVNFYDGVTLRDLQSFSERAPLSSRLVKQAGTVVEQIHTLPAAAEALDRALPFSAPPQRAVFEPLAAFFRSGEPAAFEAAKAAWTDALGLVDAFAGFTDTSADPRGRKALFGGFVGIADPERSEALERLHLRNAGEALLLVSAAGASRPPLTYALSLGTKSALFAAALEAQAQVRADAVTSALADPGLTRDLIRCGPALRFAQLAAREMSRAPADLPALEEALASASALAGGPPADLVGDPRCRELWPSFTATSWLEASAASDADRIDSDRGRVAQLELWWFTGKSAVVERHTSGRRYLAVPDRDLFRSTAQDLLALLQQIRSASDAARWRDLLDRNASRADPRWREEASARLRNVPRRVAVLPPTLEPVLDAAGNVVDAQATPVHDLDQQILRDWASY